MPCHGKAWHLVSAPDVLDLSSNHPEYHQTAPQNLKGALVALVVGPL